MQMLERCNSAVLRRISSKAEASASHGRIGGWQIASPQLQERRSLQLNWVNTDFCWIFHMSIIYWRWFIFKHKMFYHVRFTYDQYVNPFVGRDLKLCQNKKQKIDVHMLTAKYCILLYRTIQASSSTAVMTKAIWFPSLSAADSLANAQYLEQEPCYVSFQG